MLLVSTFLWSDNFEQAVNDYNSGSYIKALNTFFELAKSGDAEAQYNVGIIYANGQGAKKDMAQAMQWYEKSAEQGNGAAAYNLGKIYQEMGVKDLHMYVKAKYWYEKAIAAGVMQANNNLASLYMQGRGVTKDKEKALTLFKKAAEMGDGSALINIGIVYAWGEKSTQDKMKAYENFKKALQIDELATSKYLDRLCKESSWVCK